MKGNSGTTTARIGWSKNPVSSQTDELMAGTKFSDYLGLKHYKKAKNKTFQPFRLGLSASKLLSTYHTISPTVNSGYRLKKHILVM